MAGVHGSLTGAGRTSIFRVERSGLFNLMVDSTDLVAGLVVLERSPDGGANWYNVETAYVLGGGGKISETLNEPEAGMFYSLLVMDREDQSGTVPAEGTINYRFGQ